MINGHGDDIFRYDDIRINFSSNVYNHFDHTGLFAHLAKKMPSIVNYPEPAPHSLEAELASMLSIDPTNVMVTNGATEAIYLIAQTYRGNHSTILTPTFSEYADACHLHYHTLHYLSSFSPFKGAGGLSLSNKGSGERLLFLCNPNNPTGTVIPKDKLIALIESNPLVTFIIDASYAPFTRQPLLSAEEAVAYPNVLMLHSMTKEFAIPGLRLGFLTGCEGLLDPIRRQRMPWSVNQVAIDAGHYLIHHRDEFAFDLDALLDEREYVATELKKLGIIDVWPSDTHILLCKLRFGLAADLKDYLAKEHGILIRDASNFEGLDSTFFRIAVQTRQENNELIKAISQWMQE